VSYQNENAAPTRAPLRLTLMRADGNEVHSSARTSAPIPAPIMAPPTVCVVKIATGSG
jgi:hypothetical protein